MTTARAQLQRRVEDLAATLMSRAPATHQLPSGMGGSIYASTVSVSAAVANAIDIITEAAAQTRGFTEAQAANIMGTEPSQSSYTRGGPDDR